MNQHVIRFGFPVDNPRLVNILESQILSILPDDVLQYFEQTPVLFTAEPKDEQVDVIRLSRETFTFYKFMIHLNASVWGYSDEEILTLLLTQLAHCYLGHRSGVQSGVKAPKIVSEQELQAQEVVKHWMQQYHQQKSVRKTFFLLEDIHKPSEDNRFFDGYN